MNLYEFTDYCLYELSDKISKENTTDFLCQKFMNYLNVDQDVSTNKFLDSFSSFLYLLYIIKLQSKN